MPRIRTLCQRILLFTTTVLLLVQGLGYVVTDLAVTRNAKFIDDEALRAGQRVLARMLEQNRLHLLASTQVLASDFGFRQAAASEDHPTILSALRNGADRIGASVAHLISPDRLTLGNTQSPERRQTPFPFLDLLAEAEESGGASSIVLIDGLAYQLVVVPALAPHLIGWISMGFIVDQRVAQDMRSLSALEVSLVRVDPQGNTRVLSSTMDAGAVAAALRGAKESLRTAVQTGISLEVSGDKYQTLFTPLGAREGFEVHAVLQRSERAAVVPVGAEISSPNKDNVRHHVYSVSPAKKFELPLYGGTPTQPVRFDQPGVVTLGCNIHDWMIAHVYVSDSPYVGLSSANGRARLENVPPGDYAVTLWHPRLSVPEPSTAQRISRAGAASAELAFSVRLKKEFRPRRAPTGNKGTYR